MVLISVLVKARGQTPSVVSFSDSLLRRDDPSHAEREMKQLRNDCLERDGWKCVITGAYDPDAPSTMDIDDASAPSDDSECAHIIPFAFSDHSNTGVRYTALYFYL